MIGELRSAIQALRTTIAHAEAVLNVLERQAEIGAFPPKDMLTIAEAVSREHGVALHLMRSRSREQFVFLARAEAMRRMRQAGHTLPDIARFFGQKDHTSVIHAIRRAKEYEGANGI